MHLFAENILVELEKNICERLKMEKFRRRKLNAQAASITYDDILVCIDVSRSFSSLSTLLTCVYINCLLIKYCVAQYTVINLFRFA